MKKRWTKLDTIELIISIVSSIIGSIITILLYTRLLG